MRARFSRLGLRDRIQLLTLGAALVTAGGMLGFGVSVTLRETRTRLMDKGRVLAAMVARNGEFGVYTSNAAELEGIVAGLRADPEVAYVRFVGAGGATLLAVPLQGRDSVPPLRPVPSGLPLPAAMLVPGRGGAGVIVDVVAPVGGAGAPGGGLLADDPLAPAVSSAPARAALVQPGLSSQSIRAAVRRFLAEGQNQGGSCILKQSGVEDAMSLTLCPLESALTTG